MSFDGEGQLRGLNLRLKARSTRHYYSVFEWYLAAQPFEETRG